MVAPDEAVKQDNGSPFKLPSLDSLPGKDATLEETIRFSWAVDPTASSRSGGARSTSRMFARCGNVAFSFTKTAQPQLQIPTNCRCASRTIAPSDHTWGYTGNGPFVLRYVCHRSALDNGEPPCITFAGLSLDEAISREIMIVLEPVAIEAAVLATEQETGQQDEIISALKRELEAAQYTARRAEKQYDTTDPDNRLVASELERRWNEALQKVQQIEARIEQAVRGRQVAPATREEFETLAGDLEAVWTHPEADARLKKRILRTLIEEVVVDVDAQVGEIIAVIHWKGGVHTQLRIPRRRRGYSRTHTPKEIVDAVRVLVRICSDDTMAGALSRSGLVTGMGNRWTRERVASLRSHHGIPAYSADRRSAEGWLTLTEAAGHLHISSITLRLAIERGEIEAEHPLANGPWVINRRALETGKAAQLAERSRRQRGDPVLEISYQGVIDFSAT